jgi:purine catabolism regulator
LALPDVLALEVMSSAKVVAGAGQVNSRRVTGISVIEIPVEKFVQPGHFVLTTGVGCGHDAEEFTKFVGEIIESGASALGVATGRHVVAIPEATISLCSTKGVPLLELPWELPFSDIIQAVAERLIGEQISVWKRSESIQKSLTSVILEGGDLVTIARTLGSVIDAEVLVLDRRMRVLACTDRCRRWADLDPAMGNRVVNVGAVSRQSGLNGAKVLLNSAPGNKALSAVATPIIAGEELFGYVGILGGEDRVFGDLERYAVSQACAAAAMYFLREKAVAQTELRLRGDFVMALALGRLSGWEEALSMAEYLGYDLDKSYRALVVDIDDFRGYLGRHSTREDEAQRLKERLAELVEDVILDGHRRVMMAGQSDMCICFVEETGGGAEQYISLVRRIQERVRSLLPGISVSGAVGGKHSGLAGFATSYREALQALEFGRAQRRKEWAGAFELVNSLRALLKVLGTEEADALVEQWVRPLAEYDDAHGSELLETARMWMVCDWNASKTARRMHLHRQSLLQRLEKIKSLCPRDSWDSNARFSFQMALYLSDLGKNQTPGVAGAPQRVAGGGQEVSSRNEGGGLSGKSCRFPKQDAR